MIGSLLRHSLPEPAVYVLALDQEVASVVRSAFPKSVVALLERSLESKPMPHVLRQMRPYKFYIWTMASVLVTNLLNWAVSDSLWFLDADLFFFANPNEVWCEVLQSGRHVAATPHRFPPRYAHYIDRGKYCQCATWFKNTPEGRKVAQWWAGQCIERCDESTVGDQLYVQQIQQATGIEVHTIEHIGWSMGPWNARDTYDIQDTGDGPKLNGTPLICYHFHETGKAGRKAMMNGWGLTDYELSRSAIDWIYRPYINELLRYETNSRQINTVRAS